ncbi:MAG: hypothetical protein NTV63_01665 [Candidatus Woesearchaeota archaeon]|nr:hypothetical protein [Candidatus Woesearchaeota archaeon]
MDRKNFLAYALLIAMIALVPYASAAASVSITNANAVWTKGIDATKDFQFTVQNTGTENLTGVSFGVSDLVSGAYVLPGSFITMPSPVELNIGQAKILTATLAGVPISQQNGIYAGVMTVFYGAFNRSSTISVNVKEAVSSAAITPATVIVGGTSAERLSFYTSTFTVKNTGDYALTGISVSSNAISKYNVTFTNAPTSLASGQEQIVTVRAYIPKDQNSGEDKIGTISVTSNEASASAELYMRAANMLEIYDMNIVIDGQSDDVPCNGETCDITFGEVVKPDSKVDLVLTVKNLYSSVQKVDINNIAIDAVISEIDDGDDLELDSDVADFDLTYGKKVEKTVSFILPSKIDEGTYDMTVDVEGEDENGAIHSVRWLIRLDVEKESHDLIIKEITITPSEVSCDRSAEVRVRILNRGSQDEDSALITIENKQISVGQRDQFSVSSDEEYTSYFTIEIPSSAASATYNILTKAYYDIDEEMDSESTPIIVKKCETAATSTPTPKPTATPSDVIVQPTPTPVGVVAETKVAFTETTAYLVLLVIGVLALLIILFVIIAKLIR